ncbi:hypothetical protein DFJ74DRAFT_464447 [Hyaloraphidium curvatum]|nr:hypothetical protein DFJ74DRAFT_464447 [Hyaloraphidium curvatum]
MWRRQSQSIGRGDRSGFRMLFEAPSGRQTLPRGSRGPTGPTGLKRAPPACPAPAFGRQHRRVRSTAPSPSTRDGEARDDVPRERARPPVPLPHAERRPPDLLPTEPGRAIVPLHPLPVLRAEHDEVHRRKEGAASDRHAPALEELHVRRGGRGVAVEFAKEVGERVGCGKIGAEGEVREGRDDGDDDAGEPGGHRGPVGSRRGTEAIKEVAESMQPFGSTRFARKELLAGDAAPVDVANAEQQTYPITAAAVALLPRAAKI